jgi:anti-sigma B factor antagonist
MRPLFNAERHEDRDGVITIAFTGELDMATAVAAEEQLLGAEREGRSIVVDLRALKFIDSSGLRTILAADERIRAAGGRLMIVRGPQRVQRVFEITRLDDVLEIVDQPVAPEAGRNGASAV